MENRSKTFCHRDFTAFASFANPPLSFSLPANARAAASKHFGVPLHTHTAEALAAVDVPPPSAVVARHVGTPSVAEAAALLSGTRLLVPKTRSEQATCAVVECPE